jgi:hypothetical protein
LEGIPNEENLTFLMGGNMTFLSGANSICWCKAEGRYAGKVEMSVYSFSSRAVEMCEIAVLLAISKG